MKIWENRGDSMPLMNRQGEIQKEEMEIDIPYTTTSFPSPLLSLLSTP